MSSSGVSLRPFAIVEEEHVLILDDCKVELGPQVLLLGTEHLLGLATALISSVLDFLGRQSLDGDCVEQGEHFVGLAGLHSEEEEAVIREEVVLHINYNGIA